MPGREVVIMGPALAGAAELSIGEMSRGVLLAIRQGQGGNGGEGKEEEWMEA